MGIYTVDDGAYAAFSGKRLQRAIGLQESLAHCGLIGADHMPEPLHCFAFVEPSHD